IRQWTMKPGRDGDRPGRFAPTAANPTGRPSVDPPASIQAGPVVRLPRRDRTIRPGAAASFGVDPRFRIRVDRRR
ncbi:MAG: hypothetical protein R3236_10810, partial [Phycisphaeraceae bacterium]|nr:hypothetical protein [Phycisphaeraceae bacterium]